jgi:hypothetical protein
VNELSKLPGSPNDDGGIILVEKIDEEEVQRIDYYDFILSRHSIRQFSCDDVSKKK